MSNITISVPATAALLDIMGEVKVGKGVIIPCDDRCMFAEGTECDCECGGKNHQQGHRLTAVQMYQPRTQAGRAIQPLVRNSAEYKRAVKWLRLREEEGMTQKEIAEQAGVSAPCVRRALRQLAWTLALTIAQQQADQG
jgi:predicted DNA-binding protein (UPF0251 family)